MRASLQSINRNIITNLNLLTVDLQTISLQISSGKQMAKPSDDPVGMVAVLGLRSNLEEIQQYQENLNYGGDVAESSENILSQVKGMVLNARNLAVNVNSPDMGASDLASVSVEVRSLIEQVIILGNTQVSGRFIFGGQRTTGYTAEESAPFMMDRVQGYHINGRGQNPVDVNALPAPVPTTLAAGDLAINNLDIGASLADGVSTIYDDASAASKAAAINLMGPQTGVSATIVPATHKASGSVEIGTMGAGDLLINGVDIFAAPTTVVASDVDNVLLSAINAQQAATGVYATRNSAGQVQLTAADGRNMQVETSANGEQLTHLNDPLLTFPAVALEMVYFGSMQLYSDRRFTLETPLAADAGLDAVGLAGGTSLTGEPDDTAGDGLILVDHVADYDGGVRYTGDPDNGLDVRVGRTSVLTVGRNGDDLLVGSGVFSTLKAFENALLGQNYTQVAGRQAATDTTAFLGAGGTGLPDESNFADSTFTVTIRDTAYYPPRVLNHEIAVDVANDTLGSVAERMNNIPGLNASWDIDGFLQVQSSDPSRYKFELSIETDPSNFLVQVGLRNYDMQVGNIEQALADLDLVFEDLNTKMVDFGSRSNRILSQHEIYVDIAFISTYPPPDPHDTDMVKALVDLATKETAYEAALQASARAMRLSLVDFI